MFDEYKFFKDTNIAPPIATDSYKPSHNPIYPPDGQFAESYFEPRKSSCGLGNQKIDTLICFQALHDLLPRVLQRMTLNDVQEAEQHWADHFGNDKVFNRNAWRIIVQEYGGHIPIRVDALPEGTPIPVGTMTMRVRNTDNHGFTWLPNWFETELSHAWYPITVASISRQGRNILLKWLIKTGDPALIDFKLHDFGYRGASSRESAARGGLAHLVNFLGTDTSPALKLGRTLYSAPGNEIGFSIPALEHSTVTSWGRENEALVYERALDTYPKGLVAVVADSYNIYDACEFILGDRLRHKILDRDGVVVVRPDSGVPRDVCLRVLEILGAKFGFTINSKGYKVLHPKVRVIQGDGVDLDAIDDICSHLALNGWSTDNIAFGMGGGLLQKCNRDTFSFTFKMCYMSGPNWTRDIYKEPVTDIFKNSKRGRQFNQIDSTGLVHTYAVKDLNDYKNDLMQTFYQNGEFTFTDNMATIRSRAKSEDRKVFAKYGR